ncbi:MFS transporter [Virgibacillus halodenitrificans]|uniref:MFS transporter n=1 Tax=Virgibacillus halodenitrificans TaxID=1482 RepID=UPI00045CFF8B|nr:MFS transporter [Virgibacillus halodenitrificans]MCG1026808.1 MFS transporter [Virgibacillus halodenitrificans]CDQ30872.1 Inner membrane transport protein YnfM [Virgibacillus halodenitrificans]
MGVNNQQKKYTVHDPYFWKITISLALASFFVFASMYAVQPLLPVFVSVFDVSVSQSSMALSLTIIGLIAGLIILGFLSDRKGRTVFIKLSLIGSIVPFLLVPLLDSFSALLLLRLIQGFALAGLPAASLAYLNEEVDPKSIGVATALYISSNALGGMAGRVMTGYITDHYSWEIAFYFLAIIGLFVFLIVLIMLPGSRFYQQSNLSFRKDLTGFLYHLRNPSLILVFGMGIILQMSFTGVWSFLPFHLQEEPFSLSLHAISYMFFAYGLGVIGAPLAGWVAGYFGLRKVRMLGIIILSLGVFLTLSHSLPIIVIGLCVSCLGFFTAHSLTATSVTDQADHHKGSASSLYLVAYYIGVSLGSTALAPLWDKSGWLGLIIFVGCLPITYLIFVRMVSIRFARK